MLATALQNMNLNEKLVVVPLISLRGLGGISGIELTLIRQSDNGRAGYFEARWLGVKIGNAQASPKADGTLAWQWEKKK